MTTEDRYEALEIVLKARDDGRAWFDVLFDYLTQDCEDDACPCTCGLESMGGSGGTLDQCWKWLGVDDDKVTVDKRDLLQVLAVSDRQKCPDAHGRLFKECTWWEDWLARLPDDEEEET